MLRRTLEALLGGSSMVNWLAQESDQQRRASAHLLRHVPALLVVRLVMVEDGGHKPLPAGPGAHIQLAQCCCQLLLSCRLGHLPCQAHCLTHKS